MDYVKEYKKFVTSHYLGSGVRITVGVVLPAVVLNFFNLLGPGIVVSLGAMCASTPDTPGSITDRRNAMLVCVLTCTVVSLLTGFATTHALLLGIFIFSFCFIFSIVAVYGARVNSIGVAALLIMVLTIDQPIEGWAIALNALYIFLGGVWYMTLSLLLYSFRPYKLAQQALGECILETSEYLRIRASFYDEKVDYDAAYKKMLQQQIQVHEKQNLVRELLFKSRNFVKESTNTGRTLVMIFLDVVDLFEITMTSYQDYNKLHNYFGDSDILLHYRRVILELVKDLDNIGIAVQSGKPANDVGNLQQSVKELKEYFEAFRDKNRTSVNIEGFINLRHILESIEDISNRLYTLQRYTTYDKKLSKNFPKNLEYDKFVSYQNIDPKLLVENLSFQSNTFRHAIRLSVATIVGYIIGNFLHVGHSYWILLTIIVILKPAYSLTKQRNFQRLIGTIAGACIGFVLLYFIKDNTVIFVIMLALMVGTYTFLRTNYMVSVILMTPYILLLFHLISNTNFEKVFTDRVIDTAVGSALAFIANFLLVPAWEHEQIKNYMSAAIENNLAYFNQIAQVFTGVHLDVTQYKLSRKNAFVSLANLSDAFTRMLSEPKNKQKNSKLMHSFVVLNHMFTSHVATLFYYAKFSEKYSSKDFEPLINNIISKLNDANAIVNNTPVNDAVDDRMQRHLLNERVNHLLEKRREELHHGFTETETKKTLSEFKSIVDQFNFISNISSDLRKICLQLEEEED
jgi:uncharacterized membrane protein (TIGR01666 family)